MKFFVVVHSNMYSKIFFFFFFFFFHSFRVGHKTFVFSSVSAAENASFLRRFIRRLQYYICLCLWAGLQLASVKFSLVCVFLGGLRIKILVLLMLICRPSDLQKFEKISMCVCVSDCLSIRTSSVYTVPPST